MSSLLHTKPGFYNSMFFMCTSFKAGFIDEQQIGFVLKTKT